MEQDIYLTGKHHLLTEGSDLYLFMTSNKPVIKSKLCYYEVCYYQHVSTFALGNRNEQ